MLVFDVGTIRSDTWQKINTTEALQYVFFVEFQQRLWQNDDSVLNFNENFLCHNAQPYAKKGQFFFKISPEKVHANLGRSTKVRQIQQNIVKARKQGEGGPAQISAVAILYILTGQRATIFWPLFSGLRYEISNFVTDVASGNKLGCTSIVEVVK